MHVAIYVLQSQSIFDVKSKLYEKRNVFFSFLRRILIERWLFYNIFLNLLEIYVCLKILYFITKNFADAVIYFIY